MNPSNFDIVEKRHEDSVFGLTQNVDRATEQSFMSSYTLTKMGSGDRDHVSKNNVYPTVPRMERAYGNSPQSQVLHNISWIHL